MYPLLVGFGLHKAALIYVHLINLCSSIDTPTNALAELKV